MIQRRVDAAGKVRWRVQIRQGREYVAGRTFDTKAAAERWEAAEKSKLQDGYQPKLGRATVADFAADWLDWRASRVQPKTLVADSQMVGLLPTWMQKLELRAVTPRHVERWQAVLAATGGRGGQGRSLASVTRHRQALSGLFARAVDEGRIVTNPVSRADTPAGLADPDEINPFSPEDVYALADGIAARDWILAEVVLVMFWTGVRWGEARSLRVGDFVRGDAPILRVARSHPEGHAVKVTKSGKSRAVPVVDEILPILDRATFRKDPGDLLLTTSRLAQLHRTAFTRTADWQTLSGGRRIHDLRHGAITNWLASGLGLHVVKSMAGHASITTTERYLHFVGDAATRNVLATLNAAGRTTGAPLAGSVQTHN